MAIAAVQDLLKDDITFANVAVLTSAAFTVTKGNTVVVITHCEGVGDLTPSSAGTAGVTPAAGIIQVDDGTRVFKTASNHFYDAAQNNVRSVWWYDNHPGGSITVSMRNGTAPILPLIYIAEISGADQGGSFDTWTTQVQLAPGGAADAISSGNITTLLDGEFLLVFCSDNSTGGQTLSAGTGFTLGAASSQVGYRGEYKVAGAKGSMAGTMTAVSGTDNFVNTVAAFKPAQAPPLQFQPPIMGTNLNTLLRM